MNKIDIIALAKKVGAAGLADTIMFERHELKDFVTILEAEIINRYEDTLQLRQEELELLSDKNTAITEQNTKLMNNIQTALDCVTEEINVSNYNHDLICQYVRETDEMFRILIAALTPQPENREGE